MAKPDQSRVSRAWATITGTWALFSEIDAEQRAAAFAYYALFSLFPLIVLLVNAGSYFVNTNDAIDAIQHFAPVAPEKQQLIWKTVGQLERARGTANLVSLAILLWASLNFFQALVRAVNRAWHTVAIPWWQMPLKNLMMFAVLASAFMMGLLIPALMQGARNILNAVQSFVHTYLPAIDVQRLSSLLDLGRYALGGLVLFYAFAMLYMFAPRKRVSFSKIWIPTLIVTALLQLCQTSFVNYLPRFVNYSVLYGGVSILMLLLLWVYVSGLIIIAGACLCAAWDGLEHADATTPGAPKSRRIK